MVTKAIKHKTAIQKKALDHLRDLSEKFYSQVGQVFTSTDNKSVQGLVERLELFSVALANCSPATLAQFTKKYNKAKKANGGLKYL